MTLKDGFEIFNVGGDALAIYTGGERVDLRNAVVLNPVAEFLFQLLQQKVGREELAQKLASNYSITIEKAQEDVALFLENLSKKGLLEE
jgi:hypothetical protein